MALELPTTISATIRRDPKVFLLYGPPKNGKTTVVSKLPGCLIIDVEDGSDYVSCLKIKCKDRGEFDSVCGLIKAKGRPYKYIAIDTVDKIEEWAEVDATAKYKTTIQGKNFTGSSVLNLPNGGGYLFLRQSFNDYFNKIAALADHVILIGHIRDKMIESAGKEVSAKDLDLTGKIKAIVCAKADAIGYIYRSGKGGENTTLTFETNETVLCGSRCDHLKGKRFEFTGGPESFDWQKIYLDLSTNSGASLLDSKAE